MGRIAAVAIFLLIFLGLGSSAGARDTTAVQQHVLTADYFGHAYGAGAISPKRAAPFLTWAQVTTRDANAVATAGIRTQYYIDPARTVANVGDQLYTSDETTFAHDCLGSRVALPYDRVTEYLMAIDQPSMQAVFGRWVTRVTSVAHFDALFEDDDDLPSEYLHFRLMPCNYDDKAWLSALDALNHHSPIPAILSGLNASKRPSPSGVVQLLFSDKTLGENYEHCYSADAAHPKMSGTIWQATENSELQVNATGKLFQCMARDGTTAASAVDARIYLYASFLLTYNPATSIIWEEYATPSHFHVEPESELVALSPTAPAPPNISGLAVSSGTYVRQFERCYIAGKFQGPCAAVVNPDSSPHAFPLHAYRHSLVLEGGGVLDGGTISANGPPPASTLGPAEAVIAFR